MKKYLYILGILVVVATALFGVNQFLIHKTNPGGSPATGGTQSPFPKLQSFSGILKIFESPTVSETAVQPASSSQNQTVTPASGSGNSFSFAIFGDTKEFSANDPNGNLEKAVAQVKNLDLKAVFVMGDLIKSCGNGCENKFNDWKSVMAPLLSKTYEVVGNHDRTGGDSDDAVWQKVFNLPQNGPTGYKELVYSFDIGNSHFAVLDSEKPKTTIINSVQRDWLDKDLAASTKEHKFVLYHEPAFQVAQDAEDGLDAHPTERDALWNIIKKYHVDAVFNGHAHIYARKNIDGIQQIVVGDTDSTNDDVVQPGLSDFGYKGKSYAIVTVNGKNINLKLFTVDGKQVDSFDFT